MSVYCREGSAECARNDRVRAEKLRRDYQVNQTKLNSGVEKGRKYAKYK